VALIPFLSADVLSCGDELEALSVGLRRPALEACVRAKLNGVNEDADTLQDIVGDAMSSSIERISRIRIRTGAPIRNLSGYRSARRLKRLRRI